MLEVGQPEQSGASLFAIAQPNGVEPPLEALYDQAVLKDFLLPAEQGFP